jgi:hypothetical protein
MEIFTIHQLLNFQFSFSIGIVESSFNNEQHELTYGIHDQNTKSLLGTTLLECVRLIGCGIMLLWHKSHAHEAFRFKFVFSDSPKKWGSGSIIG